MGREKKLITQQEIANNKPTPIRFAHLKPLLQKEAHEKETSMHSLVRDIIEDYYNPKTVPIDITKVADLATAITETEKMLSALRKIGVKVVFVEDETEICLKDQFVDEFVEEKANVLLEEIKNHYSLKHEEYTTELYKAVLRGSKTA